MWGRPTGAMAGSARSSQKMPWLRHLENGTIIPLEVIPAATGACGRDLRLNLLDCLERHRRGTSMRKLFAISLLFIATPAAAQLDGDSLTMLMVTWSHTDELCRGVSKSPVTMPKDEACKQRRAAAEKIERKGFCRGHRGELESAWKWHRCEADSIRQIASP
jgi:hypothetical protein